MKKAGDMQSPLRRDTQAIEKSADEGMGKRSKKLQSICEIKLYTSINYDILSP